MKAGTALQEIIEFILELDKLKAVTRKVRPVGSDRLCRELVLFAWGENT
jgi:hypothetical protein